ncbi:MAG: cation-translocating P-type ATPase [Actinobacteria bacterium]|nr:cation-translocating P-type ATPase [Thermoleophilia bacterium]MCB9012294.1 cation-translocating P-type ATPase [Actinomycetota bacterium]
MEADVVAAGLGVGPADGLTTAEAMARLVRIGPNELREKPRRAMWRRLASQFGDPLVGLLLAAIVVAVGAWWVDGASGVPVDAVVITGIVLANAFIGLVQEHRADTAVAALAVFTRTRSTVNRDGEIRAIPARDLVPGDILVLTEGDRVGADARLLETTGLMTREASLTGESGAVAKMVAALTGDPGLGDRRNMVFRGTDVVQGRGRAVVTATGMRTEMGAIAEMLERTAVEVSPLEREVARVSRALGALVGAVALVTMATLALVSRPETLGAWVDVLLMGVSLAVAAVPEGLPAVLSLVLAIGVLELARHNAVMKDLHSVGTLGAASVICSDKTGTLTRNEMTVQVVATASGRLALTDSGGDPPARARDEATTLLRAAAWCTNAALRTQPDGTWEVQGDPTEAALLVAHHTLHAGETSTAFAREVELPFTSERRMMSVVGRGGPDGRRVMASKGAPDVLLERCASRLIGGDIVPLDVSARERIHAEIVDLSGRGYRTLGVAWRAVGGDEAPSEAAPMHETGLTWLGVVGIIDPPRPEAAPAIAEARRAGVRTVLITGDHPRTAHRIAVDLGIIDEPEGVVTGREVDAMDDRELAEAVGRISVFARVAPEHKLRIVDALQAAGHVVAMTGDGVNDAPALKAADIGVAMGMSGTEVTKGAGRMILGDDNYATIVSAIRRGRRIFDNIAKFLRYLLSSNLGEVLTVFLGVTLAGVIGLRDAGGPGSVVLPLLATQILWINLVTDSGPALAMGVDPETDDVMARRPRRRDDRIIDRAMWGRMALVGIVMAVATLLTIDLLLPGGLIEGSASLEVARTAGFTTLVLAQLVNAFSSRSHTRSAFRRSTANRWLWAAVALGAALQVAVVHVPLLQHAFGTAALSAGEWSITAVMASTVLWAVELAKYLARRRDQSSSSSTSQSSSHSGSNPPSNEAASRSAPRTVSRSDVADARCGSVTTPPSPASSEFRTARRTSSFMNDAVVPSVCAITGPASTMRCSTGLR